MTATDTRRRGSLFAQPSFRLFWTGATVYGFAFYATDLALPLIAVTVLDASPFTVGLLAAAVWVPWLVIGLPVGAWIDRMPKRRVMITCNLVTVAMLTSVPIVGWLGVLTTGQLMVVALVTGSAAVFFNTAYHAYLPTLVGKPNLMEGNAKLEGSDSTMQMLGPSVSGAIYQAIGAATGLLINAVSVLLTAACLARIPSESVPAGPAKRRPRLRSEIREGFRFVVRDRYLRQLVTYQAMTNLAIDGYTAVQVIFLIRTIGVSPATVGVLLAAGGVGGVVGAVAIRPIVGRYGSARGLLIATTIAAPFGMLMAMTASGAGVSLFAIGLMMVDGCIVAGRVVLGSFRQLYCPPEMLGRVIATTTVIKYSTIPVGSILGGLLGSWLGPRSTMWIMTAAFVCFVGILYCGPIRRIRDFPSQPVR